MSIRQRIKDCPECDGKGKYLQESYEGYKTEVNCIECKGTGEILMILKDVDEKDNE